MDPEGVMHVNANEMPWVLTMVEVPPSMSAHVPDGRSLYLQICAVCHGPNREGQTAHGPKAPPLTNLLQKLDREAVLMLVETGRGGTPAFGFLSPHQKAALADYILGTQPPRPASLPHEPRAVTAPNPLGRVPFVSTGYHRWLDPDGYPAVNPPWGTLSAIDLNTAQYRWKVVLGEYPELSARRYATPATYEVRGPQFGVIACGGGKMGTPSGDAYVAFPLPRDRGSCVRLEPAPMIGTQVIWAIAPLPHRRIRLLRILAGSKLAGPK
ncbi:MAG: c-type cytochrome [Limisphaera sp.]|nr:c-type cytochrome [Limisphaera sp.]